jgi:Arc/MetJ-type ribon-helix-helix transcriptional regulator
MPARSTTLAATPKLTDEKITINLGCVDLGHIDLLVQEGFYAHRSDFIRTAIRNQISTHQEVLKEVVARRTLVLGIQHFTAADLKAVQKARRVLDIRVLGLVSFADDVTPELALATIRSLSVLGACHASPALRAALSQRMG